MDAVYCKDDCRVNASKQRKRDQRKQMLLDEQPRPPLAFPFSESWQPMVDELRRVLPSDPSPAGYRLKRKGSLFPNPRAPLRAVPGDLISLPYYRWEPFEPPSVPESGEYQLQWFVDEVGFLVAFDQAETPTCYVPIADPQARFHSNHVTRDKVSVPAWKRQVKAKLRPLRAEIERAEAEAAAARAKAEQAKKE
ncbi:hypothetical protein [Haliangium sp. UPWRP_2]|uniref:hypothetical protein n=1 Tax=Haliangium sp. UPWRP_2 TaxID=1931276 RepID=UPI000B541963|nr:hypothetical protein [Haliangium sp. UPWRP_2]PSM31846.1 hypothetical protein BVG81_003295 [Haliangium sp. UPWRP_2]